jgi:hypothetical protein
LRVAVDEHGRAGGIELFADGTTIDKELHPKAQVALYFAYGLHLNLVRQICHHVKASPFTSNCALLPVPW